MKQILVSILFLIFLLSVGCTPIVDSNGKDNDSLIGKNNGSSLSCTEDAKICPDGTSVGRNPDDKCNFFNCSNDKPIPVESDGGIGLTNPYVQYVGYNTTQCAATDWLCIEGSSQFFDESGCGCKANEPKKYIANSSDECSRIRFMCANNYVPFFDSDGCGCEFTFNNQESIPPLDGKLRAIDCEPSQRNVDVCTLEYSPVCGWSDPAKIQCIKYPCAQEYSNSCAACKEENVAYYTIGSCPSNENDECSCPEGYTKEGDSCTPNCYFSEPKCLTPSIKCEIVLK